MVVLKDVTYSIERYICDMYCIVYKNFVTQGCKITHEWYDIYIYIYIYLCMCVFYELYVSDGT